MRRSASGRFWSVTHICLIGDSHLGAVKLGWDAVESEFHGADLTFFVAPARMMDLVLSGGSIAPATEELRQRFKRTSRGKLAIEGDYDGYIVYGLGLIASRVMLLYENCRAESHAPAAGRQPISDECFQLAYYGLLRETRAARAVALLRKITDSPIGLVAAPMRSLSHPEADVAMIEKNGDDAGVASAFSTVARGLSTDLEVSLYLQPADTLVGPLRTNPMYSRAALIRADGNIDRSDYSHMNPAYGTVVVRQLIAEFLPLAAERAEPRSYASAG